ncbi:MAG TPA: hypothetical protein VE196_12070 [Pseudonocardiaceae bacterium]|nr:hypothetical protein [Pseudonocardiaceae bacterium]
MTMAATTDFTVYSDHSDRHIGSLDTSSRHTWCHAGYTGAAIFTLVESEVDRTTRAVDNAGAAIPGRLIQEPLVQGSVLQGPRG